MNIHLSSVSLRNTIVHITSWKNKGGGTSVAKEIINNSKYPSRIIYLDNNKKLYSTKKSKDNLSKKICIPFYNILSTLNYINNLIKRKNNLIIHSHGKRAGIHSRLCKILFFSNVKVVHTFHGISSSSGFNRLISMLLECILSFFTVAVIANGKAELKMFKGIFKLHSKCFRVNQPYNLRNIAIFKRNKVIRIGFAARMEKGKLHKKLINLISIFNAKYPERKLKLIFCGNGSFKSSIVKYGKKMLPDQLIYLGHLKNMRKFYKQIDCYAHFSLFEGMPLSLVDAIVCGLPCIATNVDGSRDVIEQTAGWLVPVSNISRQLSVLEQIVLDFKNQKKKLLKCKSLGLTRFCPKKFTTFHNQLYQSLL